MKRSLYSQELLKSLDNFVREMYRLDLADNPQLIFQLGIKWTKGQPLLTKKLLQYVLESETKIARGRESARLEEIIRQRLLKEFKHDDLTLPIRKILYVKDLARLLTKSEGKIGDREQIYLAKIQQELGLSSQQSENIKGQYSESKLIAANQKDSSSNALVRIKSEFHNSDDAAFQNLVDLLERSPVYEELLVSNNFNHQALKKPPKSIGFFRNKVWWLCLSVPFLLLIFRAINLDRNSQNSTAVNDVRLDSHCSIKIESPQMSLGEKLLTQSQQLQSSAKVALYEASAAMGKCQYSTAQTKFQQTLKLEPNNPEALIYLNNTKAIAKTNPGDNLKIAVSLPFQERSGVAEEILRGVAQAQLKINQEGGIDSKLLLVQIVNNDRDSKLMAEIAQNLATDETVLAAIEYSDFDDSAIAAEVYQQHGLAMISTSHSYSSKDNKFVSIAPDVSNLVSTLVDYAAVNSFKKIAVCTDSKSIISNLFAREFATTVTQGGGEIATIPCDFAKENFNPVPVVDRALAQNADAILLSASTNSIEQAISVAQSDRGRLALLGNHLLQTNQTIEARETTSQLIITTPWLADTVTERQFANDARALWDTEVNWRSAMSYNATLAIAEGLKQTQNRSELRSILSDRDTALDEATAKSAKLAYIGKAKPDSDRYQFLPLDIDK